MRELNKLTRQLVAIPSTHNKHEEIINVYEFAKGWLRANGVHVKEFKKKGFPSMLAYIGNHRKSFDMLMAGHLDVVASHEEDFIAKRKGRRLYGRGTSDMKGVDAAMMLTMRDLAGLKKRNIGLVLTTDEEVGGDNGARHILAQGYRAKCAYVPDGGDNWRLVTEEKGIIHIKLQAKGKVAHGSTPWYGDNAIDKIIDIYGRLRQEFPQLKQKQWAETMNLGLIRGGVGANQVADTAEADLDFRFTKDYNPQKLARKIRRIVGQDAAVKIMAKGEMNFCDRENGYVKEFFDFSEAFLHRKIQPKRTDGASDARFFGAKGIPTIIMKPRCSNHHDVGEWIDLIDLAKFYNLTKEFILQKF